MKKLLSFLLACLFSMLTVQAQNGDPAPVNINFSDTDALRLNFNRFNIGYQWGNSTQRLPPAFHSYMGINTSHISIWSSIINGPHLPFEEHFSELPDSCVIKLAMDYIGSNAESANMAQARAIQFDPMAPLNSADFADFTPAEGDTTGAVFGFGYKHPALKRGIADNTDRDTIPASAVAGRTLILNNVWPKNQLAFQDKLPDNFDTRNMYLTVNMRRTDPTDTTSDTTIVALLKVKYFNHRNDQDSGIIFSSSYIKFDSVTTASSIYLSDRGYVDNALSAVAAGTDSLIIRRNMLPSGTTNRRDVTLSAFFKAMNTQTNQSLSQNPRFQSGGYTGIDSIDVEVYYYGQTGLSIDWVRLETPHTRKLMRGEYDENIRIEFQRNIDSTKAYNTRSGKHIRIGSVYGRDEIGMQFWQGHRYLNKVLNGMIVTESGNEHFKRLNHLVGYENYWISTFGPEKLAAAPFQKYGSWNTDYWWWMWQKYGYTGQPGVQTPYDLLNGHYETFLWNGTSLASLNVVRDSTLEVYKNIVVKLTDSFLAVYEDYLQQYLEIGSHRVGMLYSSKPWWSQIWATAEYFRFPNDSTSDPYDGYLCIYKYRPRTGEEVRLQTWGNIILGTKGFLYERPGTTYSQEADTLPLNGFASMGLITGTSSSESDWGSDFFESNNAKAYYRIIDSIQADTIGVPFTRIYNGRKSTRQVAKAVNQWAINNSDELMRLRLVAWYAKGFRTFWNGDVGAIASRLRVPYFDGILTSPFTPSPPPPSNYTLTRPAWRSTPEPWDSAFVDYTILRDTTKNFDSLFYIGVQNRRTSPLILSPNWGVSSGDTVKFVTTDEFNTLANLDPSKRYKQGGARTITIPFDSLDQSSSKKWVTYHIEELHDGTAPPPGIIRIDTTIIQGTDLAVNFLPGEGKLFRVTVIKPELTLVAGELSHSNQRKMVSFPSVDSLGNIDTNKVRYHIVYHKNRTDSPYTNIKGVYYKRSVEVPRTYPADMIQWEPGELLLTDSVIAGGSGSPTSVDCAYPSIVVRKDSASNTSYAYVVYGCKAVSVSGISIVESKFNANAPVQSDGIARRLTEINGRDYAEWGTPMINASATCNYYTWSDSTQGIGIGFKSPTADTLKHKRYISWALSNGGTVTGAKHPSLNSYSRISLGEDDCALAWQETAPPGVAPNTTYIYYSRLRNRADSIYSYLPKLLPNPDQSVQLNSDTTIANLSDRTLRATGQAFPVVYRNVDDYQIDPLCTDILLDAHADRVYWQGYDNNGALFDRLINCSNFDLAIPKIIRYRIIWMRDQTLNSLREPRDWWVAPTLRIWSGNSSLLQPTVSQGTARSNGFGNSSDSAVLLDFKALPGCAGDNTLGPIWDIPHGIASLYQKYGENLSKMSPAKKIVFSGNYPQLSAQHSVKTTRDFRRNRRLFEADISIPPTIMASSQYFLRSTSDRSAYLFTGFAKSDTDRCLITPVEVGGTLMTFNPVTAIENTPGYSSCTPMAVKDIPDTIATQWEYLTSGKVLSYYTLGSDSTATMLAIEDQTTHTLTPIPLPTASDTAAMDAYYVMAPGTADYYRLVMINNHSKNYHEELILDELPLMDIIHARQRMEQAKEDAILRGKTLKAKKALLTCSLSPNPARNIIRVTVSGTKTHEPLRLVISNLLGETMQVIEAETIQEIEIPVGGLPTGHYVLRSVLTRSDSYDPVIIPFVIER